MYTQRDCSVPTAQTNYRTQEVGNITHKQIDSVDRMTEETGTG